MRNQQNIPKTSYQLNDTCKDFGFNDWKLLKINQDEEFE